MVQTGRRSAQRPVALRRAAQRPEGSLLAALLQEESRVWPLSVHLFSQSDRRINHQPLFRPAELPLVALQPAE
jgi:hypothetical protein